MLQESKTKYVRVLLYFNPLIVKIWCFLPSFISRFFMILFRNVELKIGFIVRYLCLTKLSKKCGRKVIVFPHVYFRNLHEIEFGTNISIHEFSYIDGYGGISIGNNVAIAHSCSILSSDHAIDYISGPIKDSNVNSSKVVINDGVWVGCGVRILKGVFVGDGAVIAAGSVVNREVKPFSIVGGVPASLIRYRKA